MHPGTAPPRLRLSALVVILHAAACSASDGARPDPGADAGNTGGADAGGADAGSRPGDGSPDAAEGPALDAGQASGTTPIPEHTQRPGDPERGRRVLLEEGYVGCGLPRSAYLAVFGAAPAQLRLPGRAGANETMPYDYNAFTTTGGVEVVANNCLTCHAALLGGQVIVGLGDANRDYTVDVAQTAELAGLLITDPRERLEWRKWADRIGATAPYIRTLVAGVNPADNLALILFAHRDRETLAWSPTPLLDPPSTYVVPVDVPPWWRMKKKNAMFYHAGGRGDHARIMMTASVLCVDSIAEADFIDSYFPDVRAYIASIEPPPFPGTITATLAEAGREVFEATCARCHGTYGEAGRYPNLLVDLEAVGTDPLLARSAVEETEPYRDWFNGSFYGDLAQLAPQLGYVAPPLDGIWATAPYLHNGSVPSLEAVLDSSKRPPFWSRTFSPADYDVEAMAWRFTAEDHGQDEEPSAERRRRLYDTTKPGYSSAGHTFGDGLWPEHRRAVLEYLKTL